MEMICCRSCGKAIPLSSNFEPYCPKCKRDRASRGRVFGSRPLMEDELNEEDEVVLNPRDVLLNVAMGNIKFDDEEEDDLSL